MLFLLSSCYKGDNTIPSIAQFHSTARFYTSDWKFDGVEGYFTVDSDPEQYPIIYLPENTNCLDLRLPVIDFVPGHLYIIHTYIQTDVLGEEGFKEYKQIIFIRSNTGCYVFDFHSL